MLVFNNQYHKRWSYYRFKKDFENIKYILFKHLEIKTNREISIVFVDNKTSKKLNKEYRFNDYPTDVISFVFDEGKEDVTIESLCMGEIIISVDKMRQQAKEYNHSKRREMCFLFTHGLLHILGYDHITKKEEEIMFDLQRLVLNKLNIKR